MHEKGRDERERQAIGNGSGMALDRPEIGGLAGLRS